MMTLTDAFCRLNRARGLEERQFIHYHLFTTGAKTRFIHYHLFTTGAENRFNANENHSRFEAPSRSLNENDSHYAVGAAYNQKLYIGAALMPK